MPQQRARKIHSGWLGLVLALAGLGLASFGHARPSVTLLADPFQDGAVLQQGRAVSVWGRASAGQRVRVRLGEVGVEALADAEGRWRAALPASGPSPSVTLSVEGEDGARQSVTVALGEVWLCAGQSNMEMATRLVEDADREVGLAPDPDLHLLAIPKRASAQPAADLPPGARWVTASPQSVGNFSAACLFFGRELRAATRHPVGLISAAWGGSITRAWTSEAGLRGLGGYDDLLALAATADPKAAWPEVEARWWERVDPGSRQPTWAAPDLAEAGWKPIAVPGSWKDAGIAELAAFEGVLWLRSVVTLTPDQAAQAATLNLGGVAGADTTWINGRVIGAGSGGARPRAYGVESGLLRAGPNVIAIRALDLGGAGGVLGAAGQLNLTLADGEIVPLPRIWRFRRGADLDALNPVPFAPTDGAKAPAGLFNGMIAPLAPYTLAGAAWYQGESDTREGLGYQRLLAALMADWRRGFGQALPFLIVQLPSHGPLGRAPLRSRWAELREAQRRTVSADVRAALIVTTDLGSRFSLHPADKQEVGRRLALAARRLVYGQPVDERGPYPIAARWRGRTIEVAYPVGRRPTAVVGAAGVAGVQLCGPTSCAYAPATYADGVLRIAAPAGLAVERVRYGWEESSIVNLVNADGLPAAPFELPLRSRGGKATPRAPAATGRRGVAMTAAQIAPRNRNIP